MINKPKKMKIWLVISILSIIIGICSFVYVFIKPHDPKPDGIYLNGVRIENHITVKDMKDKYNLSYYTNSDIILIPNEELGCNFKKSIVSVGHIYVTIINDTNEINMPEKGCIKNIRSASYNLSGDLIEIYKDGKRISLGTSKTDVINILGIPYEYSNITKSYIYDYYMEIDIKFNDNNKINGFYIDFQQ